MSMPGLDSRLLDVLQRASSLELLQLSAVIERLLADPKRIVQVRKDLHLGRTVRFLDWQRGQMLTGVVVAMKDTQVTIDEAGSRRTWTLPYAAVEPPQPGAPKPAAPPEPPAAPRFERAASQSFADVAPAELEPAPAPASEAAALSVPVEMVEKIAQRVVAQISEKAVREIAWEVIPDLAEALIKQEIERLKAELQKT